MLTAVMLTCSMSVLAQRIQTFDADGLPLPYAHVLNEKGNMVGSTDMNGVLDDVQGAQTLHITHITCKPKVVNVKDLGSDGRIQLEKGDFALPEVVISNKSHDWLFMETYYRMIIIRNHDEVVFCGDGIWDNYIDLKSKKRWNDYKHAVKNHKSKSPYGIVAWAQSGECQAPMYNIMARAIKKTDEPDKKIQVVKGADGQRKLVIKDKQIGYVVDEGTHRRLAIDLKELAMMTGSEKKKKKVEKIDEINDHAANYYYDVYDTSGIEEGEPDIDSFVMRQIITHGYEKKSQKPLDLIIYCYSTDRTFLAKDEVSKFKKERKTKRLTPEQLPEFTRKHNIPALDPTLQAKLSGLAKD